MPPLRLSYSELDVVMAACRPLPVEDRDLFLREVARAVRGHGEIGPGIVYRVCHDVQARLWRPPDLARASGSSKYR
jgi:hypothetical protein